MGDTQNDTVTLTRRQLADRMDRAIEEGRQQGRLQAQKESAMITGRPTPSPGVLKVMPTPKRQPVTFLYNKLNWDFIRLMAEIAHYAEEKYERAEQYTESELTGEKSPVNHLAEHTRQYLTGEKHDRFGTMEHQLAAIAYNAMMEYYYFVHRGPVKALYREDKFSGKVPGTVGGCAASAKETRENIDQGGMGISRADSFNKI